MNEQTQQAAYNPHWKADRRRQMVKDFLRHLGMGAMGIFYRVLFFFGVARAYQKFLCRHNLYRKFPDGRCMWCGEKHWLGISNEGKQL